MKAVEAVGTILPIALIIGGKVMPGHFVQHLVEYDVFWDYIAGRLERHQHCRAFLLVMHKDR